MLTGFADPRIDSNDKRPNPNVTVLEWLDGTPAFRGKVAAFCSWDVFPWILNRERSGLARERRLRADAPPAIRAREAVLNQILADTTPAADGVRHDSLTFAAALEHVRAERPRVLYVVLGETDDWAHVGRYDHYLHAAQPLRRASRAGCGTDAGHGPVPRQGRRSSSPPTTGAGAASRSGRATARRSRSPRTSGSPSSGPDTPARGERTGRTRSRRARSRPRWRPPWVKTSASAPGIAAPMAAALGVRRRGTSFPPPPARRQASP